MNILKFPDKFENSDRKFEFELNNKIFIDNKPALNETIVRIRRNKLRTTTSSRRKK